MSTAYDRKFEEMKKYIPFLENMIKRLERTSSSSENPRQAQLDKIRSLRDLLLDKNKRMKMENLLKCEQVLVNLYAKVEQRDPFSDTNSPTVNESTSKEIADLETVRNKLKTVAKIQEGVETLPEIARANDIELDYTGSKEPALFQRRPNRSSTSPAGPSQKHFNTTKTKSPQGQQRRSYTRVLASPDQSPQHWSLEQSASDKPLFSRRSPAPLRSKSPPSNKKEKKTSSKASKHRKAKDLNITLNVPERSLNSLNTKDILSRILNCSDGDVDIDTLRGLRSQILGELKQTGKNDDISDLILKSYNKKTKHISKTRRKDDVEEGEISDSESEAIESIYGSLVVVDKDKKPLTQVKTIEDKDNQQRKIQIRLVINSDKEESKATNKGSSQSQAIIDLSDFEMLSESEVNQSKDVISIDSDTSLSSPPKNTNKRIDKTSQAIKKIDLPPPVNNKCTETVNEVVTIEDDKIVYKQQTRQEQQEQQQQIVMENNIEEPCASDLNQSITVNSNEREDVAHSPIISRDTKSPNKKDTQVQKETTSEQKESTKQVTKTPEPPEKFIANFYKPIEEQQNTESVRFTDSNNIEKENNTLDATKYAPTNKKATPTKDFVSIEKCNSTLDEKYVITDKKLSPTKESVSTEKCNSTLDDKVYVTAEKKSTPTKEPVSIENYKEDDSQKIPLLNEPTVPPKAKANVLSEIDILQALKNEILGESIAMPGSEVATPALHQPKLTKVASAQELMPKKRISIEKYKQKASTSASKPLFVKKRNRSEESKKQSLKLTEKECERFNFPKRMSFDSDEAGDLSDDDFFNDDNDNSLGLDDIYGDLAPKSPDNEVYCAESTMPPVIIPMDPVKSTAVNTRTDVDMRALLPTPQLKPVPLPVPAPGPQPLMSLTFGTMVPSSPAYSMSISEANIEQSKKDRISAMDPRTRRDLSSCANSPNPYAVINPDRTPRSAIFPNMVGAPSMTPTMTPSYMPSIPLLMTPNVRHEMTPTHQSFELEESSSRKHVYAPSFSVFDNRERESSVSKDASHWETNKNDPRSCRRSRWADSNIPTGGPKWEDRDPRSNFGQTEVPLTPRYDDSYKPKYDAYNSRMKNDKYNVDRRDSYTKSDCPTTPIPSFGWSECPSTPSSVFGRQEAPMTPSHPFGGSECPSTPSHPFGRSDCPTTPIHPFGRGDFNRSDCPSTPNHPFGRSECPPTPSHSFGRSDCPQTPSHPFGMSEPYARPDLNNSSNQQYIKDPRLNRRPPEHESSSYSERDCDYKSDRSQSRKSSSYKSQNKHYGGPDTSRNYERERVERDTRNYSSDRGVRQYDRDVREPSLGRSLSRDLETDRLYSRDRESRNDNRVSRNYDDFVSSREQREKSIGPISENKTNFVRGRSKSRASSVGRSLAREVDKDNISVKSDTGRHLTINTSVKATFQDFLASGKPIQIFDYTDDSRRRRAASVGRSLVRETSVGRNVSTRQKTNENYSCDKNYRFKRASSMGRELVNPKTEKSFQEVKEHFESYSSKNNLNHKKVVKEKRNNDTHRDTSKDKIGQNSSRYTKDDVTLHQERKNYQGKQPYCSRSNNRDPRTRKELRGEYRSRYKIDRRNVPGDHQNSGIVYSNDNIAKGTIMGSGFGVKNYKIPKIKRVMVEPEIVIAKETTDSAEKTQTKETKVEQSESDNITRDAKEVKKSVKDTVVKSKNNKQTVNNQDDTASDSETRVTRSRKKTHSNQVKGDELVVKLRKNKKPVIYDSGSDSGTEKDATDRELKKNNLNLNNPIKQNNKKQETSSPIKQKEVHSKSNEGILGSSFGIDDIDISENFASDPVIENINALIADLDNDLDSSKISNDSFAPDIEKLMETINSPEGNSLGDISEVIEKDLNESNEIRQTLKENEKVSVSTFANEVKRTDRESTTEKPVTSDLSLSLLNANKNICDNTALSKDHESIVSTTDIDQVSEINSGNINESLIDNDNKTERLSIPDSTLSKNVSDKIEDGLPDSTNDMHCEHSSDVTSTYDNAAITKKDAELQSSSQIETLNKIDSFLSFLQDKSKIKEVLSMLGGQSSDNDRIKKKLEKLSELVSDEEDEKEDQKKDDIKETLVDIKVPEVATPQTVRMEYSNPIDQDNQSDHIAHNPKSDEKDNTENTNDYTGTEKSREDLITKSSDTYKKSLNEELIKEMGEKATDDILDKGDTDSLFSLDNVANDNITLGEIRNKIIEEDTYETSKLEDNADQDDDIDDEPLIKTKKKVSKKTRDRYKSGKYKRKTPTAPAKTLTTKPTNKKKQSRELQRLQEDIKEMFMSDDILNATGIRMCRLAKLVTDNDDRKKETLPNSEPVVVLEKVKGLQDPDQLVKTGKKSRPKPKNKAQSSLGKAVKSPGSDTIMDKPKVLPKYKPGSKNKLKQKRVDADPYEFDADSVTDTNTTRESDDDSSDSENESLASSRSFGSTEVLAETKRKPKRKRRGTRGWQSGIIKPKNRKKKEQKQDTSCDDSPIPKLQRPVTIPDLECFTDKNYCFQKGVSTYDCRLCVYSGTDVVNHYKKQHPHTEIPLSRMDPRTAEVAIQQCEEINFQAISKIPSDRYTCRFCHKEFGSSRMALETFFWHIVSSHTGEFKHLCSECVNVTRCPFNLDIPPPPKDGGQLIGYLCGKCNFTQISLENLKTHVIVRHNDEQTEVYTINLALMSKKAINALVRRSEAEQPRVLRSLRSNRSATDVRDYRDYESDTTESSTRNCESDQAAPENDDIPVEEPQKLLTKLTFENDEPNDEPSVKMEDEEHETERDGTSHLDDSFNAETDTNTEIETPRGNPDDIVDYSHFKLNFNDSGAKEYVCCINGNDNHYKTSLLISMKKHVQSKHSEKWDGYCCLCKVIVTLQGVQSDFKDCLTHFLKKHMDDFPVLEKVVETTSEETLIVPDLPPIITDLPPSAPAIPARVVTLPFERTASPSYIAVRPLAELISKELVKQVEAPTEKEIPLPFPKIENVISIGDEIAPPAAPSPVYPNTVEPASQPEKPFFYEDVQAEVMSKKHRVVLDGMMSKHNLVKVFKCAGRFCSFTSDSPEDALLHASTHQRVGGENALNCAYCNYDACENGIDLVMHVFKEHSRCQFCCPMCFYRAAASQLVGVHYTKAHGGGTTRPKYVLRSTTAVASPEPENSDVLTREVAVQHYICNHDEGACNFRTYTPGKYIEHLQQKHVAASSHPCNLCSQTFAMASELVVHLRSHGLKLYQCTWCVHGANNEGELLSHAAARHPHRQPQAYVRVITNKDGSSRSRVLPLAYLNKSKVPTEEVSPNATKDNPVREAERSIELEKLIGHTIMMIEASTTHSTTHAPVPEMITDEITSEDSVEFPSEILPDLQDVPSTPETLLLPTVTATTREDNTVSQTTLESIFTSTTVVTSAVTETSHESVAMPTTLKDIPSETNQDPIGSAQKSAEITEQPVKTESAGIPKDLGTDIICLDSDDEESNAMSVETPVHTSVGIDTNSASEEAIMTNSAEVSRSSVTNEVSITKIAGDDRSTSGKSIDDDKSSSTMSTNDDSRQNVIDLSDEEPTIATPSSGSNKVGRHSLFKCPKCLLLCKTARGFKRHLGGCAILWVGTHNMPCPHKPCTANFTGINSFVEHYIKVHRDFNICETINICGLCNKPFSTLVGVKAHLRNIHKVQKYSVTESEDKPGHRKLVVTALMDSEPPRISGRKTSTEIQRYGIDPEPSSGRTRKTSTDTKKRYGIEDIDKLPISPILDTQVYCELCEFGTKVRLNMVRHLLQHAGSMPVPQTQPVNPVPHLETNEKHFDKMVNLASSSVLTRAPDKSTRPETEPAVALLIPPAESSRYPKYVPERQRYTCGAKGCTYISVDMAMFKRHWETLHAGAEEYRCVHCPPHQELDTSIPLTATRILNHLRMHDVNLYSCSICNYCHYRKHLVEKHLSDLHKDGTIRIVREEWIPTANPPTVGAPTMDLKAWQCGLCEFNSMLRPEVVNHCGAKHQSKMQFKCAYCPFRTSAKENVVKHQTNAHANKVEEVFYYFYREGSIPDDPDGVPRWQKQRQKLGLEEAEVKTEPGPPEPVPTEQAILTPVPPVAAPVSIDLNLVKKETDDPNCGSDTSIEDLCKKFGQFCDPDGIKYRCSLCNVVREHTREAMQCHLYEELNYRRWECAMCAYKAFHRTGLNDHMSSEHSRQFLDPRALPIDVDIEKWVLKLLDHQAVIIEKNMKILAVQKVQMERISSAPPSPRNVDSPKPTASISDAELELAFGELGVPNGRQFCCPKCEFTARDEQDMRYHLESELTKIRWCCTNCADKFQTFHEAHVHCKSVHTGLSSRPKEAIRDPAVRSGWISAVITVQKQAIKADTSASGNDYSEKNTEEDSDPNENSLLVARYAEPVTTEEQMAVPSKRTAPSADSDDERLIIDEPQKKRLNDRQCPYCDYSNATARCVKDHILRHYNMKPYKCYYCPFEGCRITVQNHLERQHSGLLRRAIPTQIPDYLPPDNTLKPAKRDVKETDDGTKTVCLYCEKSVPESETETHTHGNEKPEFAKRGELVVKCCKCLVLRLTLTSLQEHFDTCHPSEKFNYAYFKLQIDTREIHCCGHCYKKFKFLRDLKAHHMAIHTSLSLSYTSIPFNHNLHTEDTDSGKRKLDDSSMPGPSTKRVARKSTAKLPSSTLAKKSTTKLPINAPEEFTSYGAKPLPLHNYEDVTINMQMNNTVVEIDVKKLSGILKIDPKVVIRDCES